MALEGITKPYLLTRVECCDDQNPNKDSLIILKSSIETIKNYEYLKTQESPTFKIKESLTGGKSIVEKLKNLKEFVSFN